MPVVGGSPFALDLHFYNGTSTSITLYSVRARLGT
jgi:hypothetical protein